MSTKAQKEALVKQLRDICYATPEDAQRLLKANRWSLEYAIEGFWLDSAAQQRAQRAALNSTASYGPQLESLFTKYATDAACEDQKVWSIDATLKWCEDLGIDPEDPVMLSVAHMCKAKEMGSFTRTDWVNAWKLARKDTIAGQKAHIDGTLRSDLMNNPTTFRSIYNFTFDYARGDSNQRSLAYEIAIGLWDLLLPIAPASLFEHTSAWSHSKDQQTANKWLGWWKDFLADETGGKKRPISKDGWNQFLEFAIQSSDDLSTYNELDAWPSIIDSFVEYAKKRISTQSDMQE